jgi:cell wall assembly regulator SMI1
LDLLVHLSMRIFRRLSLNNLPNLFPRLIGEPGGQPGPRVSPGSKSGCAGDAEGLGRFFDGETAEDPQLCQFGGRRIDRREPSQGLVEVDPAVGVETVGREVIRVEVGPRLAVAALLRPFRPGVIDENPPHGFGGSGEEVPATVELLIADQPQVSFVNQGGRVEGMAGGFGRHPSGGKLPQLVVDEREQLGGGLAVAGLGGLDELGQIGHNADCIPSWRRKHTSEARMALDDSWGRIEAWLAAHAPSIRKSLRPSARAGALEKLQAKLGLSLPADFADSVRLHDGQKESAEHGLFPMADNDLGAMPSCRLLALAEIGREWAMMKQLHDVGEFASQKSKPARGVRDDWWNLAWVPIADNGGGDYFCLDLAPARGGSAGQVIVFFHDMNDRPRIAKSYAAWLETLAEGFESGQYVLDEDEGIVEAHDDEDE